MASARVPWAKLTLWSKISLSIDRSTNSILSAQNACASLDWNANKGTSVSAKPLNFNDR